MQIKLKNGRVQRYPDAVGRILVSRGIGVEVGSEPVVEAQTYQTRILAAAPVAEVDPAPYGYKADGTPRKRPGRAPVPKNVGEEE